MPTASTTAKQPIPTLTEILKGSEYALTIFPQKYIDGLTLFLKDDKPYVKCLVTEKPRPAKPEEIVRQLYLKLLLQDYGYPKDRITLEKAVTFGSGVHEKRADIVISDKDDPTTEYIIVEVKKAKEKDGLEQLKSYCNATGSPIGVWTNGSHTLVLHRQEPNTFRKLSGIPKASQTLSDMVGERWTLERLARENKLVHERLSLKRVILDMEDLVLANAGVDAFEEVFKLIYAKLYDEHMAKTADKGKGFLKFRIGGATAKEFYDKIDSLFQDAKREWPGVFGESDRIDLTPAHLLTCGSFLEDIMLFNSNLSVIDEAFEYLSVEVGKGKKGQYFTPRHVIDMCVDMLWPRRNEFVIDTAAGSCGFTVHSIFKVWGREFTAADPLPWQKEYASTHVYAVDFDPRSVKIAKALNLIAGDGRTNVYRANTLDPRNWDETVRAGLKPRLRKMADTSQDKWNRENYRFFDFDLLLTNPPFAGDIQDSRILNQYKLALNEKHKLQSKVGRDILFIERNLEFLRPGGRAAIVLPQGRFNNSSDETLRRWIGERGRILAVVGLHGNTFKPHTGTKTSVLFIQTWNDDKKVGPLCPRVVDYPIFMATSEKPGKDTSGEYVYRIGKDNAPELDTHHHMIVEHDLNDIAQAFLKFGRKQGFTFCEGTE
jgi:type I restriction enzyme M protein